MTIKVLDTTAVSAMLFEIGSVDVMSRCCQRYNVLTSPTVINELMRSRKGRKWTSIDSYLSTEDPTHFDPTKLVGELAKRYPELHEGELTAFLIALHRSAVRKEQVIFVTDDGAMRKKADKVAKDPIVASSLGSSFSVLRTGTIGMVLKMAERDLLTAEEKKGIAADLENSSFRCTSEILDKLRS